MSDVERVSGAASRRRERRLRSWLRHEWMTVRMELAAALHHSAGPVPNDAVRSQKTVSSWGARRPGVLEETEPPQVDAVLSYRAAGGAPSSALPQLAADDALDSMPSPSSDAS